MAVTAEAINDLSIDPSQDPDEIVVDSDAELGVSGGKTLGVSGAPESEVAGAPVAVFGVAGAVSSVDDAAFIPGIAGAVGSSSVFYPGGKFSQGFQNEQFAKEGVITEANDTIVNRPDASTPTERPT